MFGAPACYACRGFLIYGIFYFNFPGLKPAQSLVTPDRDDIKSHHSEQGQFERKSDIYDFKNVHDCHYCSPRPA